MWLLTTAALAATPGGFRVGPALPVRSVELREATAIDAAWVSQTTVAVRTNVGRRASIAAETPLVLTGGAQGTSWGLGQLRLGGYVHLGQRIDTIYTLGFEGAFQYVPNGATAESWATVRRDTVRAGEVVAVGAVALVPKRPWVFRTSLGFRTGPFESLSRYPSPFFVAELGIATVQPIAGPASVVAELEVMVDPVPLTGRVLGRFDFEPLTLDVGAQVGLTALGAGTGGPVLAVRRFF
ncbi:MAG: hypothetical protein H6737_04235 [Alphaproteobacteria bacterium]|nr:hypothetical protein [Alphaproteobacteria bacterium]